jgi:hypothetical protein
MAYSDFTLVKVRKELGVEIVDRSSLFSAVSNFKFKRLRLSPAPE